MMMIVGRTTITAGSNRRRRRWCPPLHRQQYVVDVVALVVHRFLSVVTVTVIVGVLLLTNVSIAPRFCVVGFSISTTQSLGCAGGQRWWIHRQQQQQQHSNKKKRRNNNNRNICSSTGTGVVGVSRTRHCAMRDEDVDNSIIKNEDGDAVRGGSFDSTSIPGMTVTLKIAVDANGGLAERRLSSSNTASERFTCAASLDMVHRLRADSDAILVGRGTVMADNPSLLVRRNVTISRATSSAGTTGAQQPLRIILDPTLKLFRGGGGSDDDDSDNPTADEYQIFTDGFPTVVYHCESDVDDTLLDMDERCVTLVYMAPSALDSQGRRPLRTISIPDLCRDIANRFNVHRLMVEGGAVTALAFLQQQCVDHCIVVRATTVQFHDPLPSNIDTETMIQASLDFLGSVQSGVDTIDCWSRIGLSWPTEQLEDWP
jgi:riboflavin biosynthesis pyrimidine reductase